MKTAGGVKTGLVVGIGVLALFGAILFWFASHHVVRTAQGLVVVPKRFVETKDTFADIRLWTWDDAVKHAELSRALNSRGYEKLLPAPPKEPTPAEKTAEAARRFGKEAKEAGADAWQRVKAKASALKEEIKK